MPDASGKSPPPRDALAMKQETWVDGFNVMHLIPELIECLRDEPEQARLGLLRRLSPLASRSREVWTVIFDGPRAGSGTAPGPIRVVFAPSADHWIVSRLREHPNPALITVVSNDEKDICRSARQLGARVLSSEELLTRVDRSRHGGRSGRREDKAEHGAEKPDFVSKEDVRYWLKRFGASEDEPDSTND